MADDIAGRLLGTEERASWCGDTDPTGRYVCQRIRNHALDWHECRNDKGGRHMWKVAVDPVDLPFGALLRDPKSGRWAVRFQVDDTTGKGMHAWLVPPTTDHPEVRVLHHVEVRGWQPFEIVIDQVNRLEGERDGILAQLVRFAKEFERVRASREAWALEADRLDVIATAAEYHTGPEECCDSECEHLHDDEGNFTGTGGDWCPHVEMRHATAEDAIEAHKVPVLEARIETLDREAADDAQFREAVAAALKVSPILSNAGLVSAIERLTRERDDVVWRLKVVEASGRRTAEELAGAQAELGRWREQAEARPAIPADAGEGAFGQRCEELGRIPAGRYYLTSGVEVGDNREVVSRFDVPDGVRIAGFWPSHKARIEPAPVSGSDTTADGGDR